MIRKSRIFFATFKLTVELLEERKNTFYKMHLTEEKSYNLLPQRRKNTQNVNIVRDAKSKKRPLPHLKRRDFYFLGINKILISKSSKTS